MLTQHLSEVAAQVLGAPTVVIDSSAPLATLGLTSVGMLELRTRLESSLELTLPVTLGWQYPTLDALMPYLAERMDIDLDPGSVARPAVPSKARAPGASPVGEAPVGGRGSACASTVGLAEGDEVALDEMSDGELAELLMARIDLMGGAEAR